MTQHQVHDLCLRSLSKTYNPGSSEQAVRDVSLDIARGEFVALLGPSGSGKTTTLMMIAGFEEPSSGDILVDGKSIVGMPPNRRDIGVVFQNYALFPKMNVAENIGFPLRMRRRGKAEIKATVDRLLELIRLQNYGKRYPAELSGGQQQRVALARALAFDPKLLLLDEPMGALDRKLREQLQLEVKRIQRTLGITTVYVTHDQEEAMVLADRVAIMNQGQLEQVGTPTEVYNRPVSRFVGQFLGTANFLRGRVVNAGAGRTAEADIGGARLPFAATPGLSTGSEVEIFVRPECIVVGPAGAGPLAGTVEAATFVGEVTRYTVKVGDLPVLATSQNRADHPVYAPGTAVSLRWSADNAIALAPPSA